MNREFKEDLINASELKTVGKNKEALKYFEKAYSQNPEAFTFKQKTDFGWTIYQVKIKNFKNEDELIESADFITRMLAQKDLNTNRSCVYTSSVFKVLQYFKERKDYWTMIDWAEKLNTDLLDERPYRNYGMLQKSKRERYYDWTSMAYLRTMEYEKCIETSKKAINTLKTFHNDGDTWFKWRTAKSLKEMGQLKEALTYYLEVIKVKQEWYMYRDIAEMYYDLNKPYDALDYLCPAILSKTPISNKISAYYLAYKVFTLFNPEMARKHAELYCLVKTREGHSIPYEINEMDIDVEKLNFTKLDSEITDLWIRYRYKNQNCQHGTVISYKQDKNFGFIRNDAGEEIFFHKNDFHGSEIYIGELVSFYTEKSFDQVKNKESVKAVNVRRN